jgi:hypothetical protein
MNNCLSQWTIISMKSLNQNPRLIRESLIVASIVYLPLKYIANKMLLSE